MEMTMMPIVIGEIGTVANVLVKGLTDTGTSGDYPDYSIVEISQNNKSPRDLRRLVLIQILMENHLLTLVGKTLKR